MTFVMTQPNVQVQWPSLLQKFNVQCSKFNVQRTSMSSTSKISAAYGGMLLPAPLGP